MEREKLIEIRQGQKNGEAQFLARVQQLEVPDFFFLPAHGAVEKDSLIAMSHLTHILESHLEPSQGRLSDEVLRVLVGQINFWLTGYLHRRIQGSARHAFQSAGESER